MGFLLSVANRWKNSDEACALLPFERFFTGRMPTADEEVGERPYMSLIPGNGFLKYRSDRATVSRRVLGFHIWVDPDDLERGEQIARMVAQVYANQAWSYASGQVRDVLEVGPPNCLQVQKATYQAWEVVKLLSAIIEEPRLDGGDGCVGGSTSGAASSGSSRSSVPESSA